MKFDSWFYSQSKLVQIILLVIPLVGWVVELLIRLSVMLKTKSVIHIVVFVIFILIGWGWIINIVDLVYLLLKDHLILA